VSTVMNLPFHNKCDNCWLAEPAPISQQTLSYSELQKDSTKGLPKHPAQTQHSGLYSEDTKFDSPPEKRPYSIFRDITQSH